MKEKFNMAEILAKIVPFVVYDYMWNSLLSVNIFDHMIILFAY